MTYEKYKILKCSLSEGKKLLLDGNPCVFVDFDEVYGNIWVKIPKPVIVNKNDMFAPTVKIDTFSVSIERIEVLKTHRRYSSKRESI